jgi:hypothetical protein
MPGVTWRLWRRMLKLFADGDRTCERSWRDAWEGVLSGKKAPLLEKGGPSTRLSASGYSIDYTDRFLRPRGYEKFPVAGPQADGSNLLRCPPKSSSASHGLIDPRVLVWCSRVQAGGVSRRRFYPFHWRFTFGHLRSALRARSGLSEAMRRLPRQLPSNGRKWLTPFALWGHT